MPCPNEEIMFFKLEVSKMVMIPEAYGRKGLG